MGPTWDPTFSDMTLEIRNFLQAAGIASLAAHPVAIDVPMLLQDYLAGRVRIEAPASAVTEQNDARHPNDLYFLQLGGRTVAVQPVRGVIASGVSPDREYWYGLFNLDRIHSAAATVMANQAISALVLLMDTPGGSVLGLRAAADALLNLQSIRPRREVISYSQRLNASAGM